MDLHEMGWLRWYMCAFFVCSGIYLVITRGEFAKVGALVCRCGFNEETRRRVRSAYRAREAREALPSGAMGGGLGAFSIALGTLAAATHLPLVMLYASFTLALASVVTFAYVRLRQTGIRRVATLGRRDPRAIAPWFVWGAVAMTVVSPLLWQPTASIAAITVTGAGVSIALLARRVAAMPSLMCGHDVVAEAFVDARMRAVRATNLLAVAVAPTFVFEAFTGYADSSTRVAAIAVATIALVASNARFAVVLRGPSAFEVDRLFVASP